ncbi:arylsulfatase [Arenibacter sp. ARW7G5Y1]|uniref:arylsulfatase n=1 Tax=Arenibacter sp. ARW7G5Y1 TaxID=2135619 RepID=UPI000D91E7BE|nr:arylsulfatase [Arenibacter sp. ARW7G5Y1]PXX21328.1 arylsulfatase [Arenibacter sp. ARW7G5Y1]
MKEIIKIKNVAVLLYSFIFWIIVISKINAQDRPNVMVIMADDMGYSDIGCYGGEIRTPNLNKLASEGLRFKQFYNTARCCPTRASLLTGLYPQQTGIGGMVNSTSKVPAYVGDLNQQCITMAEALDKNGYATFMTGKWHVAKSISPKDNHNWPTQRGFKKFYGTITGAGSYFDPVTLTYNNTAVTVAPQDNFYYTDAISDSTVTFLQDHFKKDRGQPFFFYVAYTAPHWPLHAPKKDIKKYKGVYDKGWEVMREERIVRMKQMGLIKDDWNLSLPGSSVSTWKDNNKMDWELQRMMTYAAQVDIMDQGIGRIVNFLKKNNQLDNTLIIFLADNGGCAETINNASQWVRKYGPKSKKTLSGKEMVYGNDNDLMAGPSETYMSYGPSWANLSNTPFRYYKHYGYEGGVAAPFIVRWPKGFLHKNEFRNEVASIIDIMPTVLNVTGTEYPSTYKGHSIQPLEGKSLLPVFEGNHLDRKSWFMEHKGNRAVREGQWKLVSTTYNGKWELYDMVKDRTETNNVLDQNPIIGKKLEKMWNEWAWRVGVFPKEKE